MYFDLTESQLSYLISALVALGIFQAVRILSQSILAEKMRLHAEKNSAAFGWAMKSSLFLEQLRIVIFAQGVVLILCSEAAGLILMGLFILCGPLGLSHYRRRRAERVDQQVESWLLQLSRAMQSAPSLSDALFMSQGTTSNPLRHEIRRLEESFHLGMSLPLALENMANGLQQPRMKQAVVTMKSGLKSGGDMPRLLKRTGDSMRELDRLGLVLRSKTAEGKTQALVISCSPLPMVLGVRISEPAYFDPLFASVAGQTYLAAAIALWLIAITLIRKILAVRL